MDELCSNKPTTNFTRVASHNVEVVGVVSDWGKVQLNSLLIMRNSAESER